MISRIVVTAALVIAATTPGQAQEAAGKGQGWQLRLPTGALLATGTQRDQIKNGNLSALQVSRMVGSKVAVTGTFGWARSKDLTATDIPQLDVFTSDIGIESCFSEYFTDKAVSLKTFAGLGGGARSYNYRKLDVDATNNLAGYVAAGAELGMGRITFRLEARDYATGFKPLLGGGKSEARNDVVVMGTFGFKRRPAEAR